MDIQAKLDQLERAEIPKHVAVIPDGNGRWAHRENQPRTEGHREGVSVIEHLIEFIVDNLSLKFLTLYTFSTENWARPNSEVTFLMKLMSGFVRAKKDKLMKNNIRLRTIGNLERVPEDTSRAIRDVAELTSDNDGLQLVMALNYGGRQELIRAIKDLLRDVASGPVELDEIDESLFETYLETAGIPYPDLLIRTSGEQRISNFLLWQVAYTEFWNTDTLWPDFTPAEFVQALCDYQERERRYGKV